MHYGVSWKGFSDPHEVERRLKNILSTELNRHYQTPGRRWFVRGGSLNRVSNPAHLKRLIDRYLPDHPGIFWKKSLRFLRKSTSFIRRLMGILLPIVRGGGLSVIGGGAFSVRGETRVGGICAYSDSRSVLLRPAVLRRV